MTIKVGDWLRRDEEWIQWNAASKDDCGIAEVMAIGDNWALLREDMYGHLIAYHDAPIKLENLKMIMVRISLERLNELSRAERHLEELQARGVDNWDGYVGPDFDEDEDEEDEDEQ